MQSFELNINNKRVQLDVPVIMGIINATPDSFYDAGHAFDQHQLAAMLAEFNQCGVSIIDIGAESSRPGSIPVSSDVEMDRLSSVLSFVFDHSDALVSVDTYKPEVAEYACSNGADIINDISGGESDDLLKIVANYNAGLVIMHKQGIPETMQNNPTYNNVVSTVSDYLLNQVKKANALGIESVIVDPGIGFGKSLQHNVELLKHINEFQGLGCPILIGTSNKSFIEGLTGATVTERLPGSIASVLATYQQGAHIFRVHNVKETVQALDVFRAIYE